MTWPIYRQEGENSFAKDQLEKEDSVRDVLDINKFVCPAFCDQYTSLSKGWLLYWELELAVLAFKNVGLDGP